MRRPELAWPVGLGLACALLTFFTVYDQLFHRTGVEFILGDQLNRHRQVLAGVAIDPWQYRLLPELVVEAAIRAVRWIGVENPVLPAFAIVRVVQNSSIFLLSALYWGRLGISKGMTIIGLAMLAWGFSYAGYGSDLAFSTYFDVLFFLLAAWLILLHRLGWIVLVIALSALNRETSALIPFLILAAAMQPAGRSGVVDRRALRIAAVGLLVFLLEYGLTRLLLGPRPSMRPYGHELGLDLLGLNLTWIYSYFSTAAAFSVIPWLALIYWKSWPPILKRFFWAIVPLWVVPHLFLGAIAEARLLLVPHVIVLLPAALRVVQSGSRAAADSGTVAG
jgi:hypothetical protein